jgi:hypothetical protein
MSYYAGCWLMTDDKPRRSSDDFRQKTINTLAKESHVSVQIQHGGHRPSGLNREVTEQLLWASQPISPPLRRVARDMIRH